jgi:transposase-like protein
MNLLDVYKELNTEDKCLAFLEHMRWPKGVKCISCDSVRIARITTKGKLNKKTGKVGPDRKLFQCNDCRFQFTTTTGTVYHDTHLPLHKWYLAIALITESKKGISANQLCRALGVQYRTAWYLAHRIRKAMVVADRPKLQGIVEIDETYVGGKRRGHRSKLKNKDVVIGVRERGGELRLVQTPDNKADTIYAVIADHVAKDAEGIMTDENPAYNFKTTQFRNVPHERIRHKKQSLLARQRAHQHRGIRVLAIQTRPERCLPQSQLKASTVLSKRVLVSVQQPERCGPVRDDGAADGSGGELALHEASGRKCVHAVCKTVN